MDHPQTTYTHGALCRLAEAGVVVVLCGQKHLPNALIVPLASHTEVVWRIADQIAEWKRSEPACKPQRPQPSQ